MDTRKGLRQKPNYQIDMGTVEGNGYQRSDTF